MDISMIIGISGICIGLIAIVLVFVFRSHDISTMIKSIETRQESFNKSANEFLDIARNIIKTIEKEFSISQHLRPELSMFLATQWRFIEKLYRYRFEKHQISRIISSNYIKDNMSILLDSGSTIDLVTSELLRSAVKGVNVYSNNVFAAIHLVGTKQVSFHLLPGLFSEIFAAVYSNEANNRIDQLGINVFILAATALRFNTGIMVNKGDQANYTFKRTAVEAFLKSEDSQLLIAVDPSKFIVDTQVHRGIFSEDEWSKIIHEYATRIMIITTQIPQDVDPEKHVSIERELKKFIDINVRISK